MATKKRRRKRRYRRAAQRGSHNNNRRTNRHHLLWRKDSWTKHPYANKLRTHHALIVEISLVKHAKIHREVQHIPVPRESNCKLAYEIIEELWARGAINDNTPVTERLEVLICIFDCIEQQTTYALREQLRVARELWGG